MTQVRKRQHVLTGMKYDRVDLVSEGANGHADILIAKNKQTRRPAIVRKAMGTFECGDCGTAHKSIKKAAACSNCGSRNMNYTEVIVTKSSSPLPPTKKKPKNDAATNAGQYTFEDEQYDQDNSENAQALGDAVERSVLNKGSGWFPVNKGSLTVQTGDGSGDDVDDVDNEAHEAEKEGTDSDKDIENKAMTVPTGLSPDSGTGFKKLDATTKVTAKSRYFGKRKPLKKERPGLNSLDYGDQGSQEVAESAEQMYRSESQPTSEAQDRRESTMSDVFAKGRRRRDGMDNMRTGNQGIFGSGARAGARKTPTRAKTTNKQRTAVAPPGNPMDVGKSRRVVLKKSAGHELQTLEALNIGTKFAENMGLILKANKPELYEAVVSDFLSTLNAAAGEWFAGSSVTKSKYSEEQAEDIAERVLSLIEKASPESEMSDEAAEGTNPSSMDKVADNSVGTLKTRTRRNSNEKVQEVVGKNKEVNKSVDATDDPYAGLDPIVKARFQRLDELEELQTQEFYLNKAKELRHLPGFNAERIAKQLRKAGEDGEEEFEYLFKTLSGASNMAEDSAVFKQYGMPGAGSMTDDDPMARAYAYADSNIQKGADSSTREQLAVEYMRQNPAEFYQPAKSA